MGGENERPEAWDGEFVDDGLLTFRVGLQEIFEIIRVFIDEWVSN